MTRVAGIAGAALCLSLISCSDSSADRDGDGAVNAEERAAEMAADAFIPMKPGRWETKFTFTEIAVPTLGKAERQQIMDEMAKGASRRTPDPGPLLQTEAKCPNQVGCAR